MCYRYSGLCRGVIQESPDTKPTKRDSCRCLVLYFEDEDHQRYFDRSNDDGQKNDDPTSGDERAAEYPLARLTCCADRVFGGRRTQTTVRKVVHGMPLTKEGQDIEQARKDGVEDADWSHW